MSDLENKDVRSRKYSGNGQQRKGLSGNGDHLRDFQGRFVFRLLIIIFLPKN